jgi:CubicO group peptidase (beta-lactamase class C family)
MTGPPSYPLPLYETIRKMKAIQTIFLLLLLHSASFSQDQGAPEQRWGMVKQFLTEQKGLSGMFIMGSGGKIMISQGYGFADRSKETPYSDQSLYTIGSITKPFTATAILLLIEQKKASVDDPISLYFPNVPTDKKYITLHQLLTHSAGFAGAIGDDYETITAEEFQARAWKEPLLFAPGTSYAYSNVGYSLLGMIIEKISRQRYSDFIEENIFTPAGMITAGYHTPGVDYNHLVHGYDSDGSDWGTSHDKNWDNLEPYWHLKANGGLLMSAKDMYQWYLALRSNTILSPSLLTMQTTPYVDEGGGSYYGYGYALDEQGECVQHNGSNGIFKADFRWFPKRDFFLFAATNDANVRLFRLTDQIIQILITGELPKENIWISVPEGSFPADEDQQAAKAFIALIQAYTQEKADQFISRYCSADMVKRNGPEKLHALFEMLHGDVDPKSLHHIFTSGQNIKIELMAKAEKTKLKIILSMAEHKVERLQAEMEGM